MAPTTVTPTQPPRFPELSSTLELGFYQALTLSIVYSIVFSCLLSFPEPVHIPMFQSYASCASHSCIHHIAVFPLTFPISLTSGYVSDSIYKTLVHVYIRH